MAQKGVLALLLFLQQLTICLLSRTEDGMEWCTSLDAIPTAIINMPLE